MYRIETRDKDKIVIRQTVRPGERVVVSNDAGKVKEYKTKKDARMGMRCTI